jgi:uncharacterized repeat protein (TIGR01451 family)
VIQLQTTDLSGKYLFGGLDAGQYQINVLQSSLPAGTTPTVGAQSVGNNSKIISLANGENNLAVDFGYNRSGASIGDSVWFDANGDGIQQLSEVGISGVEVILQGAGPDGKLNTSDDQFIKTTTDSKGYYQFGDLNAGSYNVGINVDTIPVGSQFTTPSVKSLTLQANDHRVDADFGVKVTGQIGDTVWLDSNSDGIQQVGEIGLSGVVVTLRSAGNDGVLDTADDILQSQTTDSAGKYLFKDLPQNQYKVSLQTPNGLTNTTPAQLTVNLGAGELNLKADMGLNSAGSIGDFVWHDANNDGIQQVSESGLAGVVVQLRSSGADGIFDNADDVIQLQTTDFNGKYFFNNLSAGQYQVSVLNGIPVGLNPSVQSAQNVGGNTSGIINLAAGQSDLKVDFGFQGVIYGTGKIGDTVWLDSNGDGIQNNGEKGLSNQIVTITHPGNDGVFGTGDDISLMQTTDSEGKYLFAGLPASAYQIKVTPPNGTTPTTSTIYSTTLTDGLVDLKGDFGFKGTGSIGDFVWHDTNNDGIQQVSESGLAGVVVQLRYAGGDNILGNNDDMLFTQTTDFNGKYFFNNLSAGQYQVSVLNGIPVGLNPSVQSAQNVGGNTSGIINLAAGQSDLKVDFGFQGVIYGTGKIGDTVWLDSNGDGIQNNGEKGLSNQVVTIVHPGNDGVFGTGDDISLTQTTDSEGKYLFAGLPASAYQIKVTPPNGTTPTTSTIYSTTLTDGQVDLKGDFGFANGTGKIGDFVWYDADKDGVQDAGETGISNVIIELRGAGKDGLFNTSDDVIQLQTTDLSGKYLFGGLDAGQYQINVLQSSLPAGTTPTVGAQSVGNNSKIISLANGENNLAVDFGYNRSGASIGDSVWFDANGDGIQQLSEVGISGVEVILQGAGPDGKLNTSDDQFIKTTTDSKGYYQFGDLNAGSYNVGINVDTIPVGSQFTTPSVKSLTLQANDHRVDADFGVKVTGQIGDTVWLDSNSDGIQQVGEIGLSGVVVTLRSAGNDGVLDTADDILQSQTTDSAGKYLFKDLPQNQYKVSLQTPNGLTNTTPAQLTVNLGAGELNLKADMGLNSAGSIGDFVWHDANNDGIQQVSESGLAGVVVQLRYAGGDNILGNNDDMLFTQTTDFNGKYFFNNLSAGQYQVSVLNGIPVGLNPSVASSQNVGGNTSGIINLAAGQSDLKVDFGFQGVIYGTGKIGDTVWLDSNGDGIQNNGEKGLSNQLVTITHPGNDGVFGTGDDISLTQTTDSEGKYLFAGLPASAYQIKVTPPNGTTPTTSTIYSTTLTDGLVDLKGDFGFKGTASIGDFVWHDANNDGIQQVSESGLAGVVVQLRYAGGDNILGNNDDMLFTQTTDFNGKYFFNNLSAGQYQVSVLNGIPVGLNPSVQSAQNVGGNTSGIINLAAGQSDLKVDFGYFGLDGSAALGNLVWEDLNGDGVPNNGEIGLSNVPITVTWAGPDGKFGTADDVVMRTQTDQNGVYQIKGLQAGNYRVVAETPTNHHATTPLTLEHSLQNGEFYQNALFGFQPDDVKVPDYKVTIDDGVSSVKVGQTITYTITVQNIGSANGQQVVIKYVLPTDVLINISASDGAVIKGNEIVWTVDQLGIGQIKTFTVTAIVNPKLDVTKVNSFNNVVTVIDDNNPANDPTPRNNIASDLNNLILNEENPSNPNQGKPEQPSEGKPEQPSEGKPEQPSEGKPEQPSEGKPEQPSEGKPEQPNEGKPKNNFIPDEEYIYFYYEEHILQKDKKRWLFEPNDIQFKLPPLPVAPIYSGMVAPGTSVTLKLYDENGVELGSNTVMADTGGNWLMNFPNLVLWDTPHAVRVEQLPALYNNNVMSVFDMRTFFTPAISSQLFFSHTLSINTMLAFAPNEILEALHHAYNHPLAITWDNFKSYEFVAKSSTTTQSAA